MNNMIILKTRQTGKSWARLRKERIKSIFNI